jgi:hypothetical protein
MSKSNYILINQQFAQQHNGYQKGAAVFGYAVTLAGQYVVSSGTFDDFPELFEGQLSLPGIIVIELDSPSDFPPQPIFP